MAVIRVNKNKNYITMSNYHLKEKQMSLKAKGLLSQMLSLPDNWDYSIQGLVAINKENECSIKATLDELKRFKYLIVTKKLPNETSSGRIEYIYDIYEKPKQEGEKQGVENLGVEFLGVENQVQYNNNNKITNNKILNNKEIYKEIVEYLNLKANTNYKDKSSKTQSLIQARLNEGFTKDDFKKVIDNKCSSWLDNEMNKYLRPETLFGTKFESYLNEKPTKRKETAQEWEERMEREIKEMEENERKRN